MSNPFQLTFTLKQHTPIIHFQHDQEGATLRASEVKPKLDLFIMKKCLSALDPPVQFSYDEDARKKFKTIACQQNNILGHYKPEWKSWLVGKGNSEHVALDYKVSITGILSKKYLVFSEQLNTSKVNLITTSNYAKTVFGEFDVLSDTQFFANNQHLSMRKDNSGQFYLDESGCNWQDMRPALLYSNLKLTCTSLIKILLNKLNTEIPYFIGQTNFGMRQSKGFGSFSTLDFNPSTHLLGFVCAYKKNVPGGYQNQLKSISTDWKKLKAGLNYPNYYKSDLMKYYCMMNGTRWEKRKIKKEISLNHPSLYAVFRKNNSLTYNRITGCNSDTDDPNKVILNNNYKYIRALLGLAEHYEFMKMGMPAKVKISNDVIERFKSPVTFKVVADDIYMLCHDIPSELSNSGMRMFQFHLSASHNGNNYSNQLASLPVPDNFRICHFLDSPWLGTTFEHSSQWGNYTETGTTDSISVARNMGYTKF